MGHRSFDRSRTVAPKSLLLVNSDDLSCASETIVLGSMMEIAHFIQLVNNVRDKLVFMFEASSIFWDEECLFL